MAKKINLTISVPTVQDVKERIAVRRARKALDFDLHAEPKVPAGKRLVGAVQERLREAALQREMRKQALVQEAAIRLAEKDPERMANLMIRALEAGSGQLDRYTEALDDLEPVTFDD